MLAGYTLWEGSDDRTSYARQAAPAGHWELRDVVAIVAREHKDVGSHDGHALAPTSPFHGARLAAVPGLLSVVQQSIEARDLASLGEATEADALAMHCVMLTF